MKTMADGADDLAGTGRTPRNWLAATVSTSVSTSTGTRPVQNFDHRKSRMRHRRRADDPEGRALGGDGREHEAHGDRRQSRRRPCARFTKA